MSDDRQIKDKQSNDVMNDLLWQFNDQPNTAVIADRNIFYSGEWIAYFGGYALYWVCLRRSSATRVSTVLYLSPPITMLWAWAMFNEPLSW